jgi:hypothetical protein
MAIWQSAARACHRPGNAIIRGQYRPKQPVCMPSDSQTTSRRMHLVQNAWLSETLGQLTTKLHSTAGQPPPSASRIRHSLARLPNANVFLSPVFLIRYPHRRFRSLWRLCQAGPSGSCYWRRVSECDRASRLFAPMHLRCVAEVQAGGQSPLESAISAASIPGAHFSNGRRSNGSQIPRTARLWGGGAPGAPRSATRINKRENWFVDRLGKL